MMPLVFPVYTGMVPVLVVHFFNQTRVPRVYEDGPDQREALANRLLYSLCIRGWS